MTRNEIRTGIHKVALWAGVRHLLSKGPKSWWGSITKMQPMKRTGVVGEKIFNTSKEFLSANNHLLDAVGGAKSKAAKSMIRQGYITNTLGLDYIENASHLGDFGRSLKGMAKGSLGTLGTMGLWMGAPMAIDYMMGGSKQQPQSYESSMEPQGMYSRYGNMSRETSMYGLGNSSVRGKYEY